jgi:signal transduction histidine kinase
MVLAFGPAVLVLGAGLLAAGMVRRLNESRLLVRHGRDVIQAARMTLTAVQDAETGQRGYLLTGDQRYLAPYTGALATLGADTATLRRLTQGNPSQQARLDTLDTRIRQKMDELTETIVLHDTRGLDAALAVMRSDRGMHIMGDIRSLVTDMAQEEQTLLERRIADAEAHDRVIVDVLVAGTLLAALAGILVNATLLRYAERQARVTEAAHRARSSFLAMRSQELQAPLNAIGGYTELMRFGVPDPLTGAQREYLTQVQQSQERLLGLVSALLDFLRIDAGTVAYDRRDLPLEPLLAGLQTAIAAQLLARRHSYVWLRGEQTLTVRADEEKLRQILLNLLSNAVKFTPAGGEITLLAEADGAGVAAIRVRDTGIGIPRESQATIFEPFRRSDGGLGRSTERSTERPTDGMGLGLAVAREFARGMGGDLTVESEPGVGSTFTLTLPSAGA